MYWPLILAFLQLASSEEKYKEWCGKHYESSAPATPPLGAFVRPPVGSFDLRCVATLQPYLSTDKLSEASVILDHPDPSAQIDVINPLTDRSLLYKGPVSPGKVLFKIEELGPPRTKPYELVCRLSGDSKTLVTHFNVYFLPPNPIPKASVVRKNAQSGMLTISDEHGSLVPFFPFGFYTVDKYDNLQEKVKSFKQTGMTAMNPTPDVPYFNLTQIPEMWSLFNQAGIWFQHNMRHSFSNLTQVDTQLEVVMKQPNLLAYYTADEPDGSPFSLSVENATRHLRIRDPYHPVSLALNCQDFFFEEFTKDVDIVMTDPYPIGLKSPTHSAPWGTVCNSTYGDCGCDNCEGNLSDLSSRMKRFKSYRKALGRDRSLMIWGIPQSFWDDSYWTRSPTGQEYLTSCTIYVIEGAVGLTAWEERSMTSEIKQAATQFSHALKTIIPYLATPQLEIPEPTETNDVLARLWVSSDQKSVLVMSANMKTEVGLWKISIPKLTGSISLKSQNILFASGVINPPEFQNGQLYGKIDKLGCAAWVFDLDNVAAQKMLIRQYDIL